MQNMESNLRCAACSSAPRAACVSGFKRLLQESSAIAITACLFLCLAVISCGGVSGSVSNPAQPQDFSITATPATVTIVAGGQGQKISVNAVPANGFTGTVTITLTGLPTGVTASPATLALTPATAQNVTLTAASTAAAGNATVTFTGTSGTLSHSATAALTISTAPPPPDFSLTAAPSKLTIVAGGTGQPVAVNEIGRAHV